MVEGGWGGERGAGKEIAVDVQLATHAAGRGCDLVDTSAMGLERNSR